MKIEQTSLSSFSVGHGSADITSKSLVSAEMARTAYRGVTVRAETANTISIYVGPSSVSPDTGYELPPGEELEIPIVDPSEVSVVASPASNSTQTVTLSGGVTGDTFTLSLGGQTTTPLALDILGADLQAVLVLFSAVGAGNCTVDGDGPYTITFTGALAKHDVPLITGVGTNALAVAVTQTQASAGSHYSWIAA